MFLFCSTFHEAPLILNAFFCFVFILFFSIHLLVGTSSSCGFVLVSISQCFSVVSYCFTGGVKFPQGEGPTVIHCMKNYLLYKLATCLCFLSAAF